MLSFQPLYQLQVVKHTDVHATGVTIGGLFKIGTMIPRMLLFSLLFLCGLQEALLSPLVRCSKNAFCAFDVPVDLRGAKETCEKYFGSLYQFNSKEELGDLTTLTRLSGKYWLQSSDETGPNCPVVSMMEGQGATVVRVPCQDQKLDGFFCQMTQYCSPLNASPGTAVNYTLDTFKFGYSEVFPLGTTAEERKLGGKYPDSKHLCYDKWLKAPWKCEVMGGGCEHECDSSVPGCVCPTGLVLHRNNVSCSTGPCTECAQGSQREGDSFQCKCNKGHDLGQGGKSSVEADECKACTADQMCVSTREGHECRCRFRGFVLEEGECLNLTICKFCEHDCAKVNGEYRCVCRRDYMVSPSDPTKCTLNCTERDCRCSSSAGCECLDGYVKDNVNGTDFCTDIDECEAQRMCDHVCENFFGGYRCRCREGFQLRDNGKCVSLSEEQEEEDDGSGSPSLSVTSTGEPTSAHPASLPPYIKTGSVLGIAVFIVLVGVLLVFLLRNIFKRCGSLELPPLKRPDIDIFYLQQVTTETYKRLSFDKQIKNDTQKLELNL